MLVPFNLNLLYNLVTKSDQTCKRVINIRILLVDYAGIGKSLLLAHSCEALVQNRVNQLRLIYLTLELPIVKSSCLLIHSLLRGVHNLEIYLIWRYLIILLQNRRPIILELLLNNLLLKLLVLIRQHLLNLLYLHLILKINVRWLRVLIQIQLIYLIQKHYLVAKFIRYLIILQLLLVHSHIRIGCSHLAHLAVSVDLVLLSNILTDLCLIIMLVSFIKHHRVYEAWICKC